ncbi:MAG: hypothetical protein ACXWAT_12410 [Methylobacter sp.]
MGVFDTIVYVIGEATVYIMGRFIGHSLSIERKRAQRIGEFVVLGVFVMDVIIITFDYS